METVNVYVTVLGMEDELEIDVAGFSSTQDLQDFVEGEVDSFNEEDTEYQAQLEGWEVTGTSDDSDIDWVFQNSSLPDDWSWEWIEYLGSTAMHHKVEVCEAAYELDIPPDIYEEAYSGEFRDDTEFAEDMAEQVGALPDNAVWPGNCIDWEWAARLLMEDYLSINDHYFRNM